MSHQLVRRIHVTVSSVVLVTIAAFMTSTIVVELSGGEGSVRWVKHGIVLGLFLLVPAIAATAGTGFKLAGKSKNALVRKKKRRMPIIAATGLLVLVPCAITLDRWAGEGRLEAGFFAVQSIELAAGASNLALIGMNFRDGMALRSKRKGARRRATSAQRRRQAGQANPAEVEGRTRREASTG